MTVRTCLRWADTRSVRITTGCLIRYLFCSTFFLSVSVSIPAESSRWLIIEHVLGKETEGRKKHSVVKELLSLCLSMCVFVCYTWYIVAFWNIYDDILCFSHLAETVNQSCLQSEQQHQNELNVIDQHRYGWSTEQTGFQVIKEKTWEGKMQITWLLLLNLQTDTNDWLCQFTDRLNKFDESRSSAPK